MKFTEILAALMESEPNDNYGQLSSAYDEDMASLSAKMEQMSTAHGDASSASDARIAELEAELVAAKAANWDLFQSTKADEPADENHDGEPDRESYDDLDEDPLDSLFEDKE